MQERTKSRLTLFARLWTVSTILFIALCIAAVAAGMNDRINLMGLAVIGFCITFVVQLCQLTAAFVVRRGRSIIGGILGLLLSLFVLVCCIVALGAGQYRAPFIEEEEEVVCDSTEEEIDYSFPVSYEGKEPTITDFVTAIYSQEDAGEALGIMKKEWERQQRGLPLDKGNSFEVDTENNYFRYNNELTDDDGWVFSTLTEYRCWSYTDGIYKVVVENMVNRRNGEPIDGQFSGLSFYLYNAETQRMELLPPYRFGGELDIPEDTRLIVHKLPCKGDTIECKVFTEDEELTKYLIWNGYSFHTK